MNAAAQLREQQADLFRSRLPRRPYATDHLEWGVRPWSQSVAVQKRYIQANPPCVNFWLVFDVDRPDAVLRWEDANLPAPTWIARNPENGHAHLAYGLAVPVVSSDAARAAPLKLAAAIQRAYTETLGADCGYSGLICKNPLHPSWEVLWYYRGEGDLYSLADLSDYVDLAQFNGKRRRVSDVGLGRNVTLFDKLRQWAYGAVRDYWKPGGYTDWQAAVLSKAGRYNTFREPLGTNEVRGIAKSVCNWVWKHFTPAEFRAAQGRRGRRKGEKERKELLPLVVDMRAQGHSLRAIGRELGVDHKTVAAWLKLGGGEKPYQITAPRRGGLAQLGPPGAHQAVALAES